MHLFPKTLQLIFYRLLALLVILISLVGFLIGTTPGLYILYQIAKAFVPGELHIEGLDGELSHRIIFKQMDYRQEGLTIHAQDVFLSWHPQDLRHKLLSINVLNVGQFTLVDQKVSDTSKQDSSFSFPQLPFAIDLEHAFIKQLQFTQPEKTYSLEDIKLNAWWSAKNLQIERSSFTYLSHRFKLKAITQTQFPFHIAATTHIQALPPAEIAYRGNIKLTGDANLYQWQGELVNPAPINIEGNLNHFQQLSMKINWPSINWPLNNGRTVKGGPGEMTVQGKLPQLKIDFHSSFQQPWPSTWQLQAHTNLKGIYGDAKVQAKEGDFNLNLAYQTGQSPKIKGKLTVSGRDLAAYNLSAIQGQCDFIGDSEADLNINAHLAGQYRHTPLESTIYYQHNNLNALMTLGKNWLRAEHSPSSSWQMQAELNDLPLLHPSLIGLNTQIKAKAMFANQQNGTIDININHGSYQIPELSQLDFTGGQIHASLSDKALAGEGNFIIDKQKHLGFNFNLPDFKWEAASNPQQKILGNLQLTIDSLSFLKTLNPLISEVNGQLQASLQSTGTLTNPQLTGKIDLNQGQLAINKLGLTLSPIRLNLISQNKQWKTQAELVSNGKTLTVNGQGQFFPELNGKFTVSGQEVTVLNTPEYTIALSPDLHLDFSPKQVTLQGYILVPKARIAPHTFNDNVTLTDDVVFVGEEGNSNTNPLNMNTDIKFEMGNEVTLSVKGLKGLLGGSIHLRQLPKGPLNASGELSIREGKYQAYGQDLAIEQGQLLFTGGLLTNPGIQLRAVRKFSNTTSTFEGTNQLFDFNPDNLQTLDFGDNTTVGIEVTGRLLSPKIKLFSDPPTLSQADILSMLLLGRPASQANKAGGQLLLTAISSMNLGNGTNGSQLLEQLKQKLGFDLNFQNNAQYNKKTNQTTDNTSLVIGKSLSNRLYLSYNLGLTQDDSNVVTLKYLLNKFFSIQVNASLQASGVDLLYTRQRD